MVQSVSNPKSEPHLSLFQQMRQEFRWWMIPLVIACVCAFGFAVVLLDAAPQQPFLYDVVMNRKQELLGIGLNFALLLTITGLCFEAGAHIFGPRLPPDQSKMAP